MRKYFILFSVALFLSLTSLAQKAIVDPNAAMRWTLNETVKIKGELLKRIIEKHPEYKSNPAINKALKDGNEVVVSGGSDVESEVHAVINPTDTQNIVVSPIKMSNSGISCPVYYTKDFGQTWQTSSFVNMPHEDGTMSGGGGDPVFTVDANGRIYFSWIDLYASVLTFLGGGDANMGIFWAYSDDGGVTWNTPANDTILLGQLHFAAGGQVDGISSPISDKQWMACDVNENSPYKNNVYVSYVTLSQDTNGYSHYQIKCKTKPADQDMFTTEALVADSTQFLFTQFSSITVDADGNVHVSFYGYAKNDSNMAVWQSVSTDGGQTFSAPDRISYVTFNLPLFTPDSLGPDTIPGISNKRLYPSPYMAAHPTNGEVYMTWTAFGVNTHGNTLSDIYFSKYNNGTWSSPIKVNNDNLPTAQNYYSSICTNNNGDIVISWYDRREDTIPTSAPYPAEYYYGISSDDGQTFSNVKVTSQSTDFAHIGDNNQGFGIGEYTQVLATNHYIIPVWTDNRENNGDLNIYAAFINKDTPSPSAVRIENILHNVSIYPNPATNYIVVKSDLENVNATIITQKGQKIKTVNLNGEKNRIDVRGLKAGIYYLVLEEKGRVVSSKSFEVVK